MLPDSDLQTPDPNGSPVPADGAHKFFTGVSGVVLTVVVGGAAAAFLLAVVALPTSGARHSYRLQWQQRQKEISEVQAPAQDANPQATSDAEQVHD